jgi:hypothetical protein
MLFYRWYKGVLITLACLLVSGVASAASRPFVRPDVIIPQVAKGPVLKGNLSDPVWNKGALLSGFSPMGKFSSPIQQTSVRVLYDSKYLYLGVHCNESNMSSLVARSRGRDGSVWKDDVIEVLIDTTNAQHGFYHFFMNPVGGYFSTKCVGGGGSSSEWHGKVIVKAVRLSKGWTAELAIPFSDIGIAPVNGLKWGINVCRNRIAGPQELSTWSPSPWGFERPERFGEIIFGDTSAKCKGTRLATWGDMGLDETSAVADKVICLVRNSGHRAARFDGTLSKVVGSRVAKSFHGAVTVKPGKTGLLSIAYPLDGSDGVRWVLNIRSNGVKVFEASNNVATVSAPERVWQLKDPLYKELLSKNPPGDQRFGAIYWQHTYSPNVLPAFAKEYGIRYSNEEAVKELGDSKLLTICGRSQLEDPFFLKMLDKYHVKVLYEPDIAHWNSPDAPQIWNASFLLDPRSMEVYYHDLRDGLAKWHKYIWGIYTGDEIDNWVTHQAVGLYADHKSDYPYILKVNEQVKTEYGDGKYGMPESYKDENPYRWIAFRKWLAVNLTDWQKNVYDITKNFDPEIRVISMDPPGSHRPVSLDRQAKYFDIATHQLYPPTDPNRQQFGFITKLVSDLTGKPTWTCVHVEHYAFSTTLDEVRELMSEVIRSGGKGFHFWLKDEIGNNSESGFMMATKFGFPARWQAICEINRLNSSMNEVAIPNDPDLAVLYSEDHYSSFSESYGMPNEPEWAYTFFGPNARTWFKFVNDNTIEDKNVDLSAFKAVVVPAAKYEREGVVNSLFDYANAGGTLVIGDPQAFSTDTHGESLSDVRTKIVGFPIVPGKDQDTMKFAADCPLPSLRNRSLAVAGKVFVLKADDGTQVLASFADGSPAVIRRPVGKGSVIVFAANPFTQSGIGDESWKEFFTAFSRDLGLKTGRDIWRFEFPAYKAVDTSKPDGVCLTGNYMRWWMDVPGYKQNAAIKGTYSYSVAPDSIGDGNGTSIPFASGKLTDRKSAYTTPKTKLDPKNFVAEWKTEKPVDVTFDLQSVRDVTRVNLWYSGQLPETKIFVSADGKSWKRLGGYEKQPYVKPDGVNAHEDVLDVSANLGHAKARFVRLSLGSRDAGNPMMLVECEIWGSKSK